MYGSWNVKGYERAAAVELCRRGVNPMAAVLLASRGITGERELREYMSDDLSLLSDPMSFADMDRARDRVLSAIERGEHVAVYGDYDVDGITSSSMVADYLRGRGLECDIYIPERLEEGYGVRAAALDAIKSRGATLVITVDCGITAVEEAKHAKEIGLDLVVTDHHRCGGEIPLAVAAAVLQCFEEMGEDINPNVLRCNGALECKKALLLMKVGRLAEDFVEGMACVGGCVGGPSKNMTEIAAKKTRDEMIGQADKRNVHENLKALGADQIPMHRGERKQNEPWM